MNRNLLILCAVSAVAAVATMEACSSTTTEVCPAGCNLDTNGYCDPDAGNISAGFGCNTDQDCCTGFCSTDDAGGGPGFCTTVPGGSTGTTGTTGASATAAASSTGGTKSSTSSSGGTSGAGVKDIDAGICTDETDGGTSFCALPTGSIYGTACTSNTQCTDSNFYCNTTKSKCYPKCTACTCWCFAGETCNVTSGVCETPTTATSGTSSGATGATVASATAAASTTGASSTGTGTHGASSSSTTGGTTHGTATATGVSSSSGGRPLPTSSSGASSSSGSGGTSGVVCDGTCTSDSSCTTGYLCEEDQSNDWCTLDCSSGQTCPTGSECYMGVTDADGSTTIEVCLPTASNGFCDTGSTGSTGTTGGSSGGVSNVGQACTSATTCTSDYCKTDSEAGGKVCTCNCGGGVYQCESDADCCLGTGQSGAGYENQTCSGGTNFSTGCVNNVCQ